MKILLFTNTDWSLYNFRVPLAIELREMGHNVVMASPEGNFVGKIKEAGFRHINVSVNRTGMNPVREIQTIRELKRIFEAEQPDVIHNFTPKGVLYGSTAARLSKIPTVINSITGLGYMFESDRAGIAVKIIQKTVLSWYKFALVNTEVIFQNDEDMEFLDQHGLLNNSNAHVVRSSGVNLDRFLPKYIQEEIPIIGLPARMVRAKGVETFIKAAERLKKERINARFVLAGDVDPTREDSLTIEELRKWEEENVIEWWGFQDDMPGFYEKASIICLPSFGKEGVPRTLIEAAASGKPIVTTNNTGCRDAVLDGETGFIVPVKDPVSLSEKLNILIQDKALRTEMGKKGRAFAEKTFALDIIADRTENIYNAKVKESVFSN